MLAETQNAQTAHGWSTREERIIAAIQQSESVPRAEAVRRMRRRKLDDLKGRIRPLAEVIGDPGLRICRNPTCTRGDNGESGSLDHLRVDALYCDAACKKAAQRSPKREKRSSDRQCLCGLKGDKTASLRSPYTEAGSGPQNACNREISRRNRQCRS